MNVFERDGTKNNMEINNFALSELEDKYYFTSFNYEVLYKIIKLIGFK